MPLVAETRQPEAQPQAAAAGPTQPEQPAVEPAAEAPHLPEPRQQLEAALRGLGIDEGLTESLTDLALACATVADPVEQPAVASRAMALLEVAETVTTVASQLDGVLLSATRQLTGAQGWMLLRDKGATNPDELTASQRDKWRARAKSVTRHEIEAVTGWGVGEVIDLVAVANAPAG